MVSPVPRSLFGAQSQPGDSDAERAAHSGDARSRQSSGADLSAEAQQALQFSKALGGTGPQQFSVDWLTLKALFTRLSPEEQAALGLHSTEARPLPGSTYNYDHVSSGYGPGAGGSALASVVSKASSAVFGVTTPVVREGGSGTSSRGELKFDDI